MVKIGNLEVYGVIYKIENLVNGKVYIGQTIQGFDKRYDRAGKDIERVYNFHKYCEDKGYSSNQYLLRAIRKYGFENFKVNKTLDYAFSEYELDIKEQCWIQYYNSCKEGYNHTTGGEKINNHDGIRPEDCKNVKPVIQLSLKGEYIKEYTGAKDAERKVKVASTHIYDVCYNKKFSAGGYIWVFKENYDENKDYSYKYRRPSKNIIQLDLDGNFIKEYFCASDCEKETGIREDGITRCCSGKVKSYKDFVWVYKEDYDENKDYSYKAKRYGKSKPVLVFDKYMNFIEECKSVTEASKKYNYSLTSLKNHLNGSKNTKIKNHIFIYKFKYEDNKQIKNIS